MCMTLTSEDVLGAQNHKNKVYNAKCAYHTKICSGHSARLTLCFLPWLPSTVATAQPVLHAAAALQPLPSPQMHPLQLHTAHGTRTAQHPAEAAGGLMSLLVAPLSLPKAPRRSWTRWSPCFAFEEAGWLIQTVTVLRLSAQGVRLGPWKAG
eukprot:1159778-Pelagomonas_calceolata.AAC.9